MMGIKSQLLFPTSIGLWGIQLATAEAGSPMGKLFGETVETSVNAYLINTGAKLVLIDTGAAGLFGPTLGNLLANLKAAGYQPGQVDEVYITHQIGRAHV